MTDAVATASSQGDDNAPRKQTLLRLLDALHELSEVDGVLGYGTSEKPILGDENVATADGRLQAAGAESFNRFQKRLNNLDKEV
jgi:hypothetical protein